MIFCVIAKVILLLIFFVFLIRYIRCLVVRDVEFTGLQAVVLIVSLVAFITIQWLI